MPAKNLDNLGKMCYRLCFFLYQMSLECEDCVTVTRELILLTSKSVWKLTEYTSKW